MDNELIRSFLLIFAWINCGIFAFLALNYLKTGRIQRPVHFWELPAPMIASLLLLITISLTVAIMQKPIKSQDGFYFTSFQLNKPKSHGQALRSESDPKSFQIRIIDRFESYTTSGREENGFIEVKMSRDKQVGWLPIDITKPSFNLIMGIKLTVRDFGTILFYWKSILEICVGLMVAGILIKYFGPNRGEEYSQKLDMFSMLSAGIATAFTQVATRTLIPFSQEVEFIEITFARGCLLIRFVLPSLIASGLANIIYGKCSRLLSSFEFIIGFFCIFILYLCWGSGAAWW